MKFIIEGSQSELTELIKRFGGIETEKKKDYIPPLLTELPEDEKINELAEAIRNADKDNAPQAETAEQRHDIRYFNTTAEELEKTAHDISERRAMIESMRS